MEQKDVRLNSNKRQSLKIDFARELESRDSPEKEDYLQKWERCNVVIPETFGVMKKAVQRRFKPVDVSTYKRLGKEYSTVDATGVDSCFFMKVIDAPKVLDEYNDEVDKSKHFSWELDGKYQGDYSSSHYHSGSSNSGKNFAYAYYRDEMKKRGLNPDCNIQNDINNIEANHKGYKTNPYLSQCRNDNQAFLSGKSDGGINYYQKWKDDYALDIIGTGGCRSRAIPCTDSEFAQFELMHIAKANLVQAHTAWVSTMLTQVKHFEKGLKLMTKFSQVQEFAKKFNWQISPEILVDKFGTDLVISIDTLVDEITNIAKPKPTRDDKIKARMLYEASQISSMAS